MRQYDDLNQGLKSLNQKFVLQDNEQTEILTEINKGMKKPYKKRTSPQWKYYLSSASAILLLVVIVLPFLNNDYQNLVGNNETEVPHGSSVDTPTLNDGKEEEITINIVNQTDFDIYHLYIKIFQDGVMKQSQGGMIADGSAIESGGTFNFIFEEGELEKGLYEIELDISSYPNSPQENNYSTRRVLLEITDQKEYTLAIEGNFISYTYLVESGMEEERKLQLDKIGLLKEKLSLGLSKQAIEKFLPRRYETVTSASDDNEIWRYDFGTIVGYNYNESYNYGDIAGMQAGIIREQLFIEWDNKNKINGYTFYYFVENENKKEKVIYFYEMLPDGTESERIACHTNEENQSWVCPD